MNISAQAFNDLLQRIKNNDKKLTNLDLRYKEIGDERAIALAQALEGNDSITSIYLGQNKIGDEGAKAIAQVLKDNYSIIMIDLSYDGIGDEGAKAIAQALKDNHSIIRIDLPHNKIGDEGAKAIAQVLKDSYSIISIDLSYDGIGDEGAKAIAQALIRNKSITELILLCNRIGNEGAKALSQALKINKSITNLDLFRNNIGEKEGEEIENALKINELFLKDSIQKLQSGEVLTSDMKDTLNAHLFDADKYGYTKAQYVEYLDILPKIAIIAEDQNNYNKINSKAKTNLALINTFQIGDLKKEIETYLCHEDFMALNKAIYGFPLFTTRKLPSAEFFRDYHVPTSDLSANIPTNKEIAYEIEVPNSQPIDSNKAEAITNGEAEGNANINYKAIGNHVIATIASLAIIHGVKCATDMVNGKNYDFTCYSYYANSFNNYGEILIKTAVSNVVFATSIYQGVSWVNSIIASKVASDVTSAIIKGDYSFDAQTYAMQTLQYLGTMSATTLLGIYANPQGSLPTAILLNIAPSLFELAASVAYQGASMMANYGLNLIGDSTTPVDSEL